MHIQREYLSQFFSSRSHIFISYFRVAIGQGIPESHERLGIENWLRKVKEFEAGQGKSRKVRKVRKNLKESEDF